MRILLPSSLSPRKADVCGYDEDVRKGGMGGMDMSMFGADATLTLNVNNALVKYILENKDSEHVPMFCEQLYDLAMISNQPLSVDAMSKFIERSNQIMLLLTK